MPEKIESDVKEILIPRVVESISSEKVKSLFNDEIKYFVNPPANSVIGGPHGRYRSYRRKIIVDTYGGKEVTAAEPSAAKTLQVDCSAA